MQYTASEKLLESRLYYTKIESYGHEMLPRHCDITEEASRFRNEVEEIISAETNPVIFYTLKQ